MSRRGPEAAGLDVLDSVERGCRTVREVAEDTGRDPKRVADALARLRRRGLVRRLSLRGRWLGRDGSRPQVWVRT